ncbi:ABC transporter substrate-binding protein [Aidingimonas lacisalsi]|uniref:ABC transporter substrate-binding protein n=1 Tax=Aidingimonas lacisalsi TaxID=2604086 RepID=UPI001F276A53|nr:ABC transporter substrate-binding protein [Aidingimonas lacisalsi]
MAVLIALIPAPLTLAADDTGIATIDWTLAETLVALDAPPAGVAQIDAYHDWVGKPAMPDEVVDLGLRSQPNLERLSELAPSRILISPMFSRLKPKLSRIAKVETLDFYTGQRPLWDQLVEMTHQLGDIAARETAADTLVENTEDQLERQRNTLSASRDPLLMIQLMDARHARVFGDHSLLQAVTERLGLENGWQEPTNAWGFSLVGIEDLMTIDARLVVIKPLPVGVEERLANSGLWQRLPSVKRGDVIWLDPVWTFGGLPSAQRFANLLVEALEDTDRA